MSNKCAALTIVSRNYLSFARTVAESYLRHHPGHQFFIVLVDRSEGLVPKRLECGAQVLELEEICVPDLDRLVYRYSVMELNTAVKPFALSHLFKVGGFDTLLYLDPDIWVFQPMTEVHEALAREDVSVVLVPHVRRPYFDAGSPSDVRILQSGTYNLGFIGLRRGDSATALLQWWMTKLYSDCVVDIPNGLFVDQKWIDLVPGLFADHAILHHPGYNAAYWNLHERPVSRHPDGWRVGGMPLVFFHFSGYSPYSPHQLSKHQDRLDLRDLPALKALTDAYARELLRNGHAESSEWPYAFATLPNGVRLPMDLVRDVMQWAIHAGVDTPSPLAEPDAFCEFLMSRDVLPQQPGVALLHHFLLRRRSDVAQAFPAAWHDSWNPEFRKWIDGSGVQEENLADLLPFEQRRAISDHVADAFHRLREAERADVWEHFSGMWRSDDEFQRFADWFTDYGIDEMGFEGAHTAALKSAKQALTRILHVYFLRGDVQVAFPALWEPSEQSAFVAWLRQHRHQLDLQQGDVSLFAEFLAAERELVEKMRFLYEHFGSTRKSSVSLYNVDEQRYLKRIRLTTRSVVDWLVGERTVRPIDHFVGYFGRNWSALDDGAPEALPGVPAKTSFEFVRSIRDARDRKDQDTPSVNFAGFLTAPTGMGESARSMRLTLAHAGVKTTPMVLPHPRSSGANLPNTPCLFGWPDATADLGITVANADSSAVLESFLPTSFWCRHNVGYWVWETEELPAKFRRSISRFDQIWTPSRHSASAIRGTVDRPVHVLPHALDFKSLDRARGDRRRFGLPDGTLFGFVFDPESVLERKNVAGLVEVFERAFRADDNCYLALRVNGRTRGVFDYEMIKAASRSGRVIFVEGTKERDVANDFLASLDCYVSLHRAEGFGLTCAEAMALGLPVIATGYSGNLEFMDGDNSVLVPASVIETERAFGPYPAGTRWGAPDTDHAVAALRKMRDERYRRFVGAHARASVRAKLDPAALGARARQLIHDAISLERTPPRVVERTLSVVRDRQALDSSRPGA